MKTLWVITAPHVIKSVRAVIASGVEVDVIVPVWIVPDYLDLDGLHVYPSHSSDDFLTVIDHCLQKTQYNYFIPSWPDHLTDQVAALCRKHNVSCIQQEAADVLSSKSLYYHVWSILGIPMPDLYTDTIEYPCIVKPSWGTAGIGIKIIENAEQLAQFFYNDTQHRSLGKDYIVQQYITGTVCSVMGSIKNKQCHIDMCYDINSSAWPYVAETELSYPSQHNALISTIAPLVERFARYIGLNNTVFMLDLIIDSQQNIYFLDFGARLSVNGQLLMKYSGEQQYVTKLLNNQPAEPKLAVLIKELGLAPGTIQSISCGQADLAAELVLPERVVDLCQDDCVYHNGYAIIVGADLEDVGKKYNQVIDSITVHYTNT